MIAVVIESDMEGFKPSAGVFLCSPSCDRCTRADLPVYVSTAAAIDAAVAAGWTFKPEGEGRLTCPTCSAVERSKSNGAANPGEAKL